MKSKQFFIIASVLFIGLFCSFQTSSFSYTRHYDRYGNEISEETYREIANQWNESLQQKGIVPRPGYEHPPAQESFNHPGNKSGAPEPSAQKNLKIFPGEDQEKTGKRKALLWKVKTPKNTVYFLGSIHVMKKDSYPLPSVVENAYSNSDTIVFEVDLEEMSTPEARTFVAQTGMYTDGQTLQQNIPAPLYQEVKKRMTAYGMPPERFNLFKPWFCALTMTTLAYQRLGYKPEYGIDLHFTKKAITDRKESFFFETIESQLNMFAELSKKEQISFLEQALKDIDNIEKMASVIFTAWENGETEKLNSILSEAYQKDPEMYDLMIVQRNRNWVKQLESLTNREGNVMVIGGCLHFIGKNSVLEMLKEKGYEVRQISREL